MDLGKGKDLADSVCQIFVDGNFVDGVCGIFNGVNLLDIVWWILICWKKR